MPPPADAFVPCLVSRFHRQTSGFGFNSAKGRCSQIWLKYSNCVDAAESDPAVACKSLREDYMECLHHAKEYSRQNEVIRKFKQMGQKLPEPGHGEESEGDHHHRDKGH